MTATEERITTLEELLRNFRILSQDGITVYGSLDEGLAVDTTNESLFGGVSSAPFSNPPPVPGVGACCNGTVCSVTTGIICAQSGGTYQGDGSTCSPNPCLIQTGACCVGNQCTVRTAADCATNNGTYFGDGTVCSPNPCENPPGAGTGACCSGGSCSITTAAGCGGDYHGDGSTCTAGLCSAPTQSCGGCGFAQFGAGTRKFFRRTTTVTRACNFVQHQCQVVDGDCPADTNCYTSHVETYDPATCVYTDGGVHGTSNTHFYNADGSTFCSATSSTGCTDCGGVGGICDASTICCTPTNDSPADTPTSHITSSYNTCTGCVNFDLSDSTTYTSVILDMECTP